MSSPTTFRRRRFVAIGLSVMLLAGAALATKYTVDVVTGPVAGPQSGGGDAVVPADGLTGDDRVSLDDDGAPAIANLDPALLDAMRRAAADAFADEGIPFYVTSGWRSPEMQQQLFDQAVRDYGSAEEAARWVASPQTSQHVSGDAIDIGDFDATYWLSLHGAAYGLCQIYANERWHFELRADAPTDGCPEQYLDPTYDPRTRG
jgi:zinc D-Ala-D-Ala carboxypeptidase